jgi:biotin operon repressor
MKGANVCAVNSCVAELRENGYQIECKQHGHERFVYRLIKAGQQEFSFAGAV